MKNTLADGGARRSDASGVVGGADGAAADQVAFRALYKELVETNTSSRRAAARWRRRGWRRTSRRRAIRMPTSICSQAPGHPKEGGLVAVLHGTEPRPRPCCFSRISTWSKPSARTGRAIPSSSSRSTATSTRAAPSTTRPRRPSGSDTLIRYKQEGFQPRRDLKLALTCGEETSSAFNGARLAGQTSAN